jgi:hypothetical protein
MGITNRTKLGVTALEGRDVPSTTNLFDANFYLARNPDVAAYVEHATEQAQTRWLPQLTAFRRQFIGLIGLRHTVCTAYVG